MTTYARIAAGAVAEIIEIPTADDIADAYHPDIVKTCVALTTAQAERVQVGWSYDGSGDFTAPEPVTLPTAPRIVTPRTFRLRFTPAERSALTLAASRTLDAGDATLQVFLDDLSAAQEVDLDHPEIRAGLDAIVVAGLIPAARAAEILAT